MFIVFEGLDGCGKTTQAKLLAEFLAERGDAVILTAEPTKGDIGEYIREILSSKKIVDPITLALLFTADRREHLMNEIEPALKAGKIVISERYFYSTICYQAAQGVNWEWLVSINEFARKPDVSIFLDSPVERSIEKIKEKIQRERIKRDEKLKELRDVENRLKERIADLKLTANKLSNHRLTEKKLINGLGRGVVTPNGRVARYLMNELMSIEAKKNKLNKDKEEVEKEYKKIHSKYLKFKEFERPTTLEANNEDYGMFLMDVKENYLKLDMVRVDADGTIDEVSSRINKAVERVL
ncbi:MAG: dTMP kinase [Candidatus Altiarchaeota archaeon]